MTIEKKELLNLLKEKALIDYCPDNSLLKDFKENYLKHDKEIQFVLDFLIKTDEDLEAKINGFNAIIVSLVDIIEEYSWNEFKKLNNLNHLILKKVDKLFQIKN